MNIFIGNLSSEVTEAELRGSFEPFGKIDSVVLIKDKYTGQSKGFAFVEMPSKNEAEDAIKGLNGTPLKGKNLTVNEARPREARSDSRGGFGGHGGNRGGFSGGKGGGQGNSRGGGFGAGKSGQGGGRSGQGRGR
ncbi:MAG: RNA-binding protein [Bacteroidetes bacterium]|nr:RNA-binding protein [Bacteroidota bacterium]MBU1116760.1 RNA-binding protein [Bacteroidota bacterium]MBU1798851.1 RNA-binding protein [Bacteroidota bacterium]